MFLLIRNKPQKINKNTESDRCQPTNQTVDLETLLRVIHKNACSVLSRAIRLVMSAV